MLTKEQVDQFTVLDEQVRIRTFEVAKELLLMRGWTRDHFLNFEYVEKGDVTISFEDGHCGSCIDTEYVTFPLSYLYTDNWKEIEQTRIDTIKREAEEKKAKEEEAAALAKVARVQQKEIDERKQYETLKQKYGTL